MRLNLNPGVEPYDLFGNGQVILHCRPALADVIEQAKSDASILELADEVRDEIAGGGEVTPEMLQSRGRFSVLFTQAIARQIIERWDGIEDPDGSPAPVTPDRVDALLSLSPVFDAFAVVVLSRWLVLSAEKNDSAPSPIGTSGAVKATAKPARRAAKSAPKS